MIARVHVPKGHGTCLGQILGPIFGARSGLAAGAIGSKDTASPELASMGARVTRGDFIADPFDEMFPEGRLLAGARHPVEGLVSKYRHFLRPPHMRGVCCRAQPDRNLDIRVFRGPPLEAEPVDPLPPEQTRRQF